MPPILNELACRLAPADLLARHGLARLAPVAVFHFAALAVLLWSESGVAQVAAFVLAWALVNAFWIVVFGRPGIAAALSFALLVVLIAVSRFKFSVLGLGLSFIDVMVIDTDTFKFLMSMFPKVRTAAIIAAVLAIPALVLIWQLDFSFRMRRRRALTAGTMSLAGIAALSIVSPVAPGEAFGDWNYLSHFARTGFEAVSAYAQHGFLESDPLAADRLRMADACHPASKPPHIILVHDESSFDIRAVDGIKVPAGYGHHFLSLDGRQRNFMVEGAGGPSWFTEYNVLSGLSSRSYGSFQFFVTRIAAGRVIRGLPRSLARCGYHSHALYPVNGNFLGARSFYKSAGIDDFIDSGEIKGHVFEPDAFYYDHAQRLIERERGHGPMFLYVYLTANHFTWDEAFHPELTPAGWRDPGNDMPEVNEFLRRQAMSERDYVEFLARLKRDFPGEEFLIARYGDHQPDFGKLIVDPKIDVIELGKRLMAYDPRYFRTYYAIDSVNFRPKDLSSALETLDAPHLPLVIQDAAGLPLDPSFAEQKKILERCNGQFYACNGGAEARRFNRMLIDAGLIKGL